MDRTEIILTEGWRFMRGDIEPAWQKSYDDSSWEEVMLPHDWSVTGPYRIENSSGTGYLDGGIAWYRGRFSLPEKYRGKSVRLVFEGVYKNAKVFFNSYYLGRRPFGYAEFSYDITSFVNFGKRDNEISVRVSHPDVADSRWFTGSGIHRKVRLVIEEPVHAKEHGVIFNASAITKKNANITVRNEIVNDGCEAKEVTATTVFTDKNGEAVLTITGSTTVPAKGEAGLTLKGKMKDPALWSTETPNLYEMKTCYTVDGETYVADCENVGVRKLTFDPDKGFFLNDVPTKMRGVCVHHDAGSLGAAVPREVWQRRLEALKEMNCNAIRCAHNPHSPELYELCDAMGFMVMDEAFDEWEGCKNKWSTGHNVYPPRHQGYYEDFPEWHEADLKMMVRRDRNHPSVVMWSVGNEIDYPNDPYCHPRFTEMTGNNDKNKPAAERQYNPDKPNMERLAVLAKELVEIVKTEDTERPVTTAAAFPELSTYLGFVDHMDVIGYNYKEKYYQDDKKRFPDRCFLGTENSGAPQAWTYVEDNDFVIGQFIWTGIDYLGEARGWPVHGSGAGFLTTAGFKKDNFWDRKAIWTGKVNAKDYPENYFWRFFRPELFTAEDEAKVPKVDRPEKSTAPAVKAEVSLYKKGDVFTGETFKKASSRLGYLYQIIVEVKDAKGVLTNDEQAFSCQVTGAGEFLAIDNGNNADLTPPQAKTKKTFNGQLVIYVRRTGKGKIKAVVNCANAKIAVEKAEIEL
ncbi:MAG: beta galactosidase jelly roll domain-containing protein [Lachnospiraceae bacterium]|nr:beta galactosidase jelly roll domain-containing protein [Lachnospiraceae bacterium]